jgi:hypothetical protein
VPLDLGIELRQQSLDVSAVECGDGAPAGLDVLLRHPPLLKPGGFESRLSETQYLAEVRAMPKRPSQRP